MNERQEELMDKIDDVLHGEELDTVVPILLTFLATAGYLSGMDKKRFVTHVVEGIDRMFERAGRENSKGTGK